MARGANASSGREANREGQRKSPLISANAVEGNKYEWGLLRLRFSKWSI